VLVVAAMAASAMHGSVSVLGADLVQVRDEHGVPAGGFCRLGQAEAPRRLDESSTSGRKMPYFMQPTLDLGSGSWLG